MASALVEVPAGTLPGEVFHEVVGGGTRVAIVCPPDASAGDVLQIDVLLARLHSAEQRDNRMAAHAKQYKRLEATSPTYGWRVGRKHTSAFDPYLTEQQSQQRAVAAAHTFAIERHERREEQRSHEHEALVRSGGLAAMERAGRHSAPSLAVRPLAAQRGMMKATEAHAPLQATMATTASTQAQQPRRAANAAVAQHEATLIGRQQQQWRDPRGRAFRCSA